MIERDNQTEKMSANKRRITVKTIVPVQLCVNVIEVSKIFARHCKNISNKSIKIFPIIFGNVMNNDGEFRFKQTYIYSCLGGSTQYLNRYVENNTIK